jgi:hypothetical protein
MFKAVCNAIFFAESQQIVRALAAVALTLSLGAQASPVTVSYKATLGFDPTATVGTGGQNAATLINELFGSGIGASGSASITGTFTWETSTPPLNTNSFGAGYTNAITAASLGWAGSTTNADMSEIAANAATSYWGYNTFEFGGFCGTRETCATLGQPFTPTGNILQTGNDTNFFLIRNGSRVDYLRRDFIAFGLGTTASSKEFTPAILTPTFGEVSIDGVNLLLISTIAAALSNSVAIPTDASFLTSDQVDTTLFSITFNGAGLRSGLVLEGAVSEFTVTPPPAVPLPATTALVLVGLAGLGFARRKHR